MTLSWRMGDFAGLFLVSGTGLGCCGSSSAPVKFQDGSEITINMCSLRVVLRCFSLTVCRKSRF